ncbi:MAG TPA: choice-of-anchor tandem repeat GloVer-containing protein [Terriglobia bacterium]|nr:choice-of-anchor tandem repeat GloVer-containing protein [Terriglobia bacterium]
MAIPRHNHVRIFAALPATAAMPAQQAQNRNWLGSALALAIAFMLTSAATQPAQAQTFNVINTFTGGGDGANPFAGVTLDQAGNLYGTTFQGGQYGIGTVYELRHKGSGWTLNALYTFNGTDGANPQARVIFGSNGTLYGTTQSGGARGNGTVFNLRPFPSVCKSALCPWMENPLYAFQGYQNDGANPGDGDLLFDQAGDIYGTTYTGGADHVGTVYELTPSGSGWQESVLHSFSFSDGAFPSAGVISDDAGNLYGTTDAGGSGYGTVFELMQSTGWTENLLYSFQNGNDGF